MMEMFISILILAFCCYFDIKNKSIPSILLIVGVVVTIMDMFLQGVLGNFQEILYDRIMGAVPGAMLLVLYLITNKKVGMGDGILLMTLGLLLGFEHILVIFCIGLFLQSLLASFLLVFKKANKHTQIPFVPFLMLGNIFMLLYVVIF